MERKRKWSRVKKRGGADFPQEEMSVRDLLQEAEALAVSKWRRALQVRVPGSVQMPWGGGVSEG